MNSPPDASNPTSAKPHESARKTMLVEIGGENPVEKCRSWLEKSSLSDETDGCSCCASSEYSFGDSAECGSTGTWDGVHPEMAVGDVVRVNGGVVQVDIGEISPITHQSGNVYNNVCINKSKKIHLGNVTYINGPVYVQTNNHETNLRLQRESSQESSENGNEKSNASQETPSTLRIMRRREWLAQPALELPTKLQKPAKVVVICHSATENSNSSCGNILLVRLIQQFHVESRHWSDVAYNFMVGCDGNTYEGRGWGVVGAHTFRYNRLSLGICFVGCFIHELPSEAALKQAKELLEYGVQAGHIDTEYSLIGHRQCIATESPGTRLYQEICTWPHFDRTITVNTPHPDVK